MTLQFTRNKTAYKEAIKLLTKRDYSEYKLTQKLLDKGFSQEETTKALEEIKQRNWLREDYYIEGRLRYLIRKGYGPKYIKQKLSAEHLHIPDHQIQEMYTELKTTTVEQIEYLANKRNPKGPEEKLIKFLLNKGHDFQEIKSFLYSRNS